MTNISKIDQHFEEVLKAKEVPYDRHVVRDSVVVYFMTFMLSAEQPLLAEVGIHLQEGDYTDAQIIFRDVHRVNETSTYEEALEVVNQVNALEAGYFAAHVTRDKEIFLRGMMRVGEDTHPLYETLVYGTSIARLLSDVFTEKLGETVPLEMPDDSEDDLS